MEKTKAGKLKHAFRLLPRTSDEKKDFQKLIKNKTTADFKKKVKCTKCGLQYAPLIERGGPIPVHPLLGVLFCTQCVAFYGNGEFSVDSDEEEKYCRWCGEGGTLFECSKCIAHFCPKCVKKNLGADALEEVEKDDDWQCFVCCPKPLWRLRHIAELAQREAAEIGSKKKQERLAKLADLKNKVVGPARTKKVVKQESSSSDEGVNKSHTTRQAVAASFSDLAVKLGESSGAENIQNILNQVIGLCNQVRKKSETLLRKLPEMKTKQQVKTLAADVSGIINLAVQGTWRPDTVNNSLEKYKIPKISVIKEAVLMKSPGSDDAYNAETEDEATVAKNSNTQPTENGEDDNSDADKSSGDVVVLESTSSGSPEKTPDKPDRKSTKKSSSKPVNKKLKVSSEEVSSESDSDSPKKLQTRKERTERREKRLARSEKLPKTLDDEINTLTNLKTLKSRRKILESDSGSSDDKPLVKKPGKKTEKVENKETLLDMINMICSDEGEELEDVDKVNGDQFAINAKSVLKDLLLNTSMSEGEDTPQSDEPVKGEKEEKKLKRKRASSSSSSEVKKSLKKRIALSDSSLDLSDTPKKKKKTSPGKKKKQVLSDSSSSSKKKASSDDEKTAKIDCSDSISDLSDSSKEKNKETDKKKKKKQKVKDSSESEEDSDSKTKKKKKFKRIAGDDDSSSSSSCSVEFVSQGSGTPKKGRKNIKKLMKKDALQVETRESVKNEEQRKKRLKEREKKWKELFGDDPKKLVLDFDDDGEIILEVNHKLVKKLKPHQRDGVKFMWDNCFESLKEMETSNGDGCILAHCMGLGKTMQVITLLHTVLSNDIKVSTALIVCPLNTVANWAQECEMWFEVASCDSIDVYDLQKHKNLAERRHILRSWHENGGILIISYDMYRILTRKKKNAEEMALVRPGPDIIVCDEGHLLKNEASVRSRCLSMVQTCRRIVLTGTPLQNNLKEYHCMVQFIKPNILGTKQEFMNRFVNPICNGQFEDSTARDVEIMKRRSHVLHTMLEGCIQRCDYSVLTPFLPPKHEFVLCLAVSEPLANAYRHYLTHLSAKAAGNKGSCKLFNDFHSLQQIWTHPLSIQWAYEKAAEKRALAEEAEEEEAFLDDGDENVSSEKESSGSSIECLEKPAPHKRSTRSNPVEDLAVIEEVPEKKWWEDFITEDMFEDEKISSKLVILFAILDESQLRNDKVLVFSQSLVALDLIEHFLEMRSRKGEEWAHGLNYFRLDGKSSSDQRATWCKAFNRPTNQAAKLFLISTKAGGLGINLVGANRVVIFDASWNPSHDLQSIFRIYRFGQTKQCYIYRLLAEATMEEKIYERQVTKLSLAGRVVDEHQIERHYTMGNLQELYRFEPIPKEEWKSPILPKDDVLAKILKVHADVVVKYHEHDSLLENKQDEELTEEERKAAWEDYEMSQRPQMQQAPMGLQLQQMQAQYAAMFAAARMAAPGMNPRNVHPSFSYPIRPETGQFINPFAVRPSYPSYLNNLNLDQIPRESLERVGQSLQFLPVMGESVHDYRQRLVRYVDNLRKSGGVEP